MPRANKATAALSAKLFDSLKTLSGGERAELVAEMAAKGRADFYFFMTVALRNRAMTGRDGFQGRVCAFLQDPTPRKWLQLPRDHFKSTIGTVGKTLHHTVLDPSEHQLLVSAVQPISQSFLFDIKSKLDLPSFRLLYPEIRADKVMWMKDRARIQPVEGYDVSREPTWTAASIKTGVTGGHYTRICWDDLVTIDNVRTRAMAAETIERFLALKPIKDAWDTPELICGTPYKHYDLYAWLSHSRPHRYKKLSLPILTDVDDYATVLWPEEYPAQALDELQEDPETWWAQYMLQPRPPSLQRLKREDFRYFFTPGEKPVGDWKDTGAETPIERGREGLTVYLGWDPCAGTEGGDEAGLVAVGTDDFGNLFVLEAIHGNWSWQEQVRLFFNMVHRWDPAESHVEMMGGMAWVEGALAEECRQRGEYPYVVRQTGGNVSKTERVEGVLRVVYCGHKVFHHHLLLGSPFEEYVTMFPDGRYDDVVDALAYAVQGAMDGGHFGGASEARAVEEVWSGFRGRNGVLAHIVDGMEYPHDELYEQLGKAVSHSGLFG